MVTLRKKSAKPQTRLMFQNISFERNKVNGIDSDEEEDLDERINTPKSVRGNSFIKRTTVKVPLKDDKTTNMKRSGTPTVVNKLTQYQSRNSTPLKKGLSDNDREDTLIREAKLISEDNELAYGSPGRSFLKPTTKSPFMFEKTIGSPPSFKIKPVDLDKKGEIEVTVKGTEDIEYESAGSDDDMQGPSVKEPSPKAPNTRNSPALSDKGPRIPSSFGIISPNRPMSSERNVPHRGISTVDPQFRKNRDVKKFYPRSHDRSSSRHVSPPAPLVRLTSPNERPQTQFRDRPNNIASSVEAESISTTIDKGSLQVGIPSRIEVEHDRAEIMEKIDPRMSFEDNEIDLESGISSDDNAAELLNELDSFLPKSSPNKLFNGRQWNGDTATVNRTTVNGNLNREYERNIDLSMRSRIRRPLSNTPELTPIRKHYGRLNERFARHLNNKRKQEKKPELPTQFELTESEKLEIPEPESPEEEAEKEEEEAEKEEEREIWTNHKWKKLNKLIMCGKFTIQDILNSQVSTKWFQCKNKEDLKQRIEFLIQFNEYRVKKN